MLVVGLIRLVIVGYISIELVRCGSWLFKGRASTGFGHWVDERLGY